MAGMSIPSNTNKKVTTSFRIQPELLRQFKRKHPRLGNRSKVLVKLIDKYLQGRIVLSTN